ncbi:MAG: hypothetical protein M3417_05870 [Actinomycetota bacterium]|nr:hypothetical protein [Actinomycetota bacterium]
MRLPGAKRTARAPDGRRWRVGRRWTTTERPRLRRRRRDRDDGYDPSDYGKQHSGEGQGGRLDGAGDGDAGGGFGVGDLLDGDSLAIGLILVVVLGLAFFLLFPVLEAVIAVLLLAGGVASRVVLRRPWRVEARLLDGDRPRARAHWDVVGFRRSGRVAREVAEHLTATGELPAERPREALPERAGT